MTAAPPTAIDEMVDGRGALRPHWRLLLGAFGGLGPGGVAERAHRLDRALEDEGVGSVLPGEGGVAWRCDPVPLPLPAAEFAALEAGLAQRARLLEAVLADFYGPLGLLAERAVPAAMVYANPAWLRPYDIGQARPARLMDFYAADLVRGPDGAWRVLADRTAGAAGAGYAVENRRLLARVMPEAFRGMQLRPLGPFFDVWQDALARLAPVHDAAGPSIALLTPGPSHPHWFEHMFLARALSCALVESGDLSVRDGVLYLKTLRGLQPIDVVLRRMDGRLLDPLELEPAGLVGVPGLMDAARAGSVRISNDPGSGAVEAPALSAWLPALSLRLLGQTLVLPSVPTLWLGEARARAMVADDPARWLIRPALDGRAPAVALAALSGEARAKTMAQIGAQPWAFAATAALPASLAPCAGPAGLEARPVVLRVFMIYDGAEWRALEGGLARVLDPGEQVAGQLPRGGLSKDVWVLSEDREQIVGPPAAALPPLPIRRMTGDLPSRVADNLFWLGRTIERMESSARLTRAALQRLGRDSLLPREVAELQVLARCLVEARVVPADTAPGPGSFAPLADALLAAVRDGGAIGRLFAEAARLTDAARDRLTADMHAAFTHALRAAHADTQRVGRSLDALSRAMSEVVRYSALVSGIAAESMVRGGGWLFLDLGRRIERALGIARAVAVSLDGPQARIEAGLRLILELCDSTITYRGRYMTVVQPAPVLDLVLADESNPRGLSFQLIAVRDHLRDVAGRVDGSLPKAAGDMLLEVQALVERVARTPDQAAEAALLPVPLNAMRDGIVELSERVARRYFALLPAIRTVGTGGPATSPTERELRGAA